MRDLERRVEKLEIVTSDQDDWQFIVCDEERPDGTLLRNGAVVGKRPINGLVAFKRRPE